MESGQLHARHGRYQSASIPFTTPTGKPVPAMSIVGVLNRRTGNIEATKCRAYIHVDSLDDS